MILEPAALPRRDRIAIVAALAGLTGISWFYLIAMAHEMGDMPGALMPTGWHPWSTGEIAATFAMWWVMMAGMMLPSAAPMILTFATINRQKRGRGQPAVPVAVFVAGYLAGWGLFCVAATAAQWGLQRAALLSPALTTSSAMLGGLLFVAAGIYQLTPLKHACLDKCRSPFAFLLNAWRDGAGGAFRMGLAHGLYCLGCCWLLMGLLFVGGVMNLLWVALLAALVLAEKLLAVGDRVASLAGAAMLAFGFYLLIAG